MYPLFCAALRCAAVRNYRENDPRGWAGYVAEAEELTGADVPITDEWAE